MSNELVRSGQKYLATSSDDSLKKDVGGALVQASVGATALYGLSLLPFISLPLLLVVVFLLGGYLYIK